jgi:glycosyltransferase involved in cell wall biosynthesis
MAQLSSVIRVCHLISGDLWAGAEVMNYHLLKSLKKFDDLEISAIVLNEGRLADEIRDLDIPVDVLPENERSFTRLVKDIQDHFVRRPPDIVHAHRYKENILAFFSSIFRGDIRLISTQHGMPEYIGEKRSVKYRIFQKINFLLLSHYFRKLVAVSGDMEQTLLKDYGFSKRRIAMIHNGTEIPENPPSGMTKEIFRIGSMGRFFPVKNYTFMVEIAKWVHKETDAIRFELAGDGPEQGRIKSLVEQYGLEKTFQFLGFLDNTKEFYQGMDLYLNTSLHEGIPMSVLDAMSHGIPVIAPDTGGLREMINSGVEGYLMDRYDPKAFAERILRLSRDTSLKTSMGYFARARVERDFSNDHMAREYHQLYQDVIGA